MTDYPDQQLVDNMRYNAECNLSSPQLDKVDVGVSSMLGLRKRKLGNNGIGLLRDLSGDARWMICWRCEDRMDGRRDTTSYFSVTSFSITPK